MGAELTPQLIKSRLAGKRVMLVGGAGFIGHNLAVDLRQYDVPVMVVDNLMLNNIVTNVTDTELDPLRRDLNHSFLMQRFDMMRDAGAEMFNADARNSSDLAEAFRQFRPTDVVHLSAIASAVDARKVPGLTFDLQLVTLRNALELSRTYMPDGHVMFLSSSTVYGDFDKPTVDETDRPRPRGIYANAKFMGERLMRTYTDQYNIATTMIRPSALYGERCISRRVSQAFIENALSGKPLLLEGGGSGRLDFTHISDLVDGMTRAIAVQHGSTNTFNLTFGNARTIADLAAIVKDVVPDAILEERPRDDNKPVRGTLSTQRAQDELGFVPKLTLEVGYRRYCEWYVDQWERAKKRISI